MFLDCSQCSADLRAIPAALAQESAERFSSRWREEISRTEHLSCCLCVCLVFIVIIISIIIGIVMITISFLITVIIVVIVVIAPPVRLLHAAGGQGRLRLGARRGPGRPGPARGRPRRSEHDKTNG